MLVLPSFALRFPSPLVLANHVAAFSLENESSLSLTRTCSQKPIFGASLPRTVASWILFFHSLPF